MSAVSSQASERSTRVSLEPGFDIRSSVSRILTGGTCSGHGGRGCPSGTTYETWNLRTNRGERISHLQKSDLPTVREGTAGAKQLIFSAEVSPARTCRSRDSAEDSCTREAEAISSSSSSGSLSLFDPDGFSSRTYPVSSLATAVGTSEQSLERWPTSGTAWPGGFSTHVTSACRSDEGGCSSSEPSLTEILEPPLSVPARFSLSAVAARGILRRALKRGRSLPSHLSLALEKVARTTTTGRVDG